jgi:hypothetical protein
MTNKLKSLLNDHYELQNVLQTKEKSMINLQNTITKQNDEIY